MYTSLDYMADIPSFDFYKSQKKKQNKKIFFSTAIYINTE
jgi:hypothetical protein